MNSEGPKTVCQAAAFSILERERVGMERYGATLDPATDPRDFLKEAIEEQSDALVYLEADRQRRSQAAADLESAIIALIGNGTDDSVLQSLGRTLCYLRGVPW